VKGLKKKPGSLLHFSTRQLLVASENGRRKSTPGMNGRPPGGVGYPRLMTMEFSVSYYSSALSFLDETPYVAKLHDRCHAEYREKVQELGGNNAVANWIHKLEYDLDDLDIRNLQQDAARRVVNFEDEFTSLVSSFDLIRLPIF
jgi:hypothetical protein